MRIGKFNTSRIKKLKIHGKAKAKQAELQMRIKNTLPRSGEEIGKTIERKITSSQKVWSNVGVALFGQRSLESISNFSSYLLGFIMLFLTVLVLIFPTDMRALAPSAITSNLVVVFAGLLIANAITYTAMRLIGSKTRFKVFFSTVNTAVFLSLIVVAIPAAVVSFAIFSTMLRSESAISLLFSIIPFYNYLIYGWASESVAKLKGVKSVLVALVALLVILFLNLIIGQLMV